MDIRGLPVAFRIRLKSKVLKITQHWINVISLHYVVTKGLVSTIVSDKFQIGTHSLAELFCENVGVKSLSQDLEKISVATRKTINLRYPELRECGSWCETHRY